MTPMHVQDAAHIALAAYGQFPSSRILIPDALTTLNNDAAGFSMFQATDFLERYQLALPTYNDATVTGNSSFDVSVFVGRQGEDVGKLVLAIRGTAQRSLLDVPNDWAALDDIAARGAALGQIVAMHNWWLRTSTLPSAVPQGVGQYAFSMLDGRVTRVANVLAGIVFPTA